MNAGLTEGTFYWAMYRLAEFGDKVRRAPWPPGDFIHLDGYIKNKTGAGVSPSYKDLVSTDWEILVPTFGFAEAVKHLRSGKAVARRVWTGAQSLKPKAGHYALTLSSMEATDWMVVD
jgi:hypothetical protein